MGASKIAELYKLKLDKAPTSEEVSSTFVDNALTIHKRLLNLPQARKVVQAADDECKFGKNPFSHISKLLAIVQKCGSPDNIIWVCQTIWDNAIAKKFPEPPTQRAYLGNMPGSGGKGIVELQCFKNDMRKYLLADALVARSWPADIKATNTRKLVNTTRTQIKQLCKIQQNTCFDAFTKIYI